MITNEQRDEKLLQYYERGVLKQEIRSYEVSLWTLQDEFITVLKWSDVEQKGRIEKPKMTLNIDGTEKFTFTIPMYYRLHGQLIENPNWYNTQNGNLITGLRKLKVILNKGESEEAVFEFVIIDVKESHEKDIKTCEVSAEGLAFQELGKIGYKLSLTQEVFEAQYEEWSTSTDGKWTRRDGTKVSGEPLQTVDYWCKEAGLVELPATLTAVRNNPSLINSHTWYYTVCMNWKSFADGISARSSNKVYEEPYTSSWTTDLAPSATENYREMARAIECENSNLYNITQSIAEKFQIFCRYEYIHDANYHIVGKIIIFYNNFLQEEDGTLSFIYPYSISKTERTMECADTTTKLYVLDVENDTTLEGVHTIMNAPCNASREEYILDFSYMYATGAITKDQWEAIRPYEVKMREYNDKLIGLQQQLMTYQIQLPELEAKCTVAKNSLDLDKEQVLQNNALLNKLDEIDGVSDGLVDQTTPDYLMVLTHEEGYKYINLKNTNKGIKEDTVKIYTTFTASGPTLSNQINSFKFDYDEYDNITAIIFTQTVTAQSVYLTYSYDPKLYYQKILNIWTVKSNDDRVKYEEALREIGPTSTADTEYDLSAVYSYYAAELNLSHQNYNIASIAEKFYALQAAYNAGLNKRINEAKTEIETETRKKQEDIKQFERLMGPALREGYWQPEDYNDYGDHQNYSGTIAEEGIIEDSGSSAIIAWDETLFDGEDKLYYETGINQTKEYYPCINLSIVFPNGIPSDLNDYSVVWKANANGTYNFNSIKDIQQFAVGSQALIKFIKYNNHLTPVLMLVGAKTFSAAQLARLTGTAGAARIEKYTLSVSNGQASVTHSNNTNISANAWILIEADTDPSTTPILYPRIKFSSLALKTDTSNLTIKYDNHPLELGYDYYINVRDTLRNSLYYTEYYITVKPESLIKYGYTAAKQFNINYVLSNANTAIYLDALKVSKENAWPKVSYSVSTNILNADITHTLYNKRAQIVMINDFELKFNNVFGYISGLELDLDQPQNDTIEVKNYKTKFEDLFSTITAQTEEMKRAGSTFPAAMEGNVALSHTGFMETLTQNEIMFNAYLDSYFDSSQVVKDKLASLFTEASEILSDSNKSLESMRALTLENAEILANFAQNITEELTVQTFQSDTKPTKYKTGDIWIDGDGNTYVATSSSKEGGAIGTSGFVRTRDGTLASIAGAKLDINADDGEIRLMAANNLYLASNQVDIVGNDVVNIGGAQVNIVSLTKGGTSYNAGGINLIASGTYRSDGNYGSTARVLISPTRIEMGAATLYFKAASTINMIASTGNAANTSAITLDPNNGIWIGSGKTVKLFSGTGTTGSNVILTPTQIKMGVTNNSSASAFDLTASYLIMTVGTSDTNFSSNTVTMSSSGSMTGMKLTKDSFGLAIGSGSSRTVLLANSSGLELGSGTDPETNGSYVSISGSGVSIGSLADLYVNANNFKLQTNAANSTSGSIGTTILAIGTNLNGITSNTDLTTLNASSSVSFIVNDNGVFIKGYVYAAGGSFTGNVSANTFTAISNKGKFIANGNNLGFYSANDTAIMTLDGTTMTVNSGYTFNISGELSLTADSNKFIINSSTPKLYMANNATWANATSGLQYVDNTLSIKGAITATSFTLTGDATSQFETAVNNAWSTNGLGTATWQNKNYTALTSTSGLLLGMDYGSRFVIPVSANSADTYVDICQNYIKFDGPKESNDWSTSDWALSNGSWITSSDGHWYAVNKNTTSNYINLETTGDGAYKYPASTWAYIGSHWYYFNEDGYRIQRDKITENNKTYYFDANGYLVTPYIHITRDGIEMAGPRLQMNGEDAWGRDDIIILKTGSSQEVEEVESRMKGSHDWVMIKPYYNANLTFSSSGTYYYPAAGVGHQEQYILLSADAEPYFGNGASNYYYTLRFKMAIGDGSTGITETMYFALIKKNNKTGTITRYNITGGTGGNVYGTPSGVEYAGGTDDSKLWRRQFGQTNVGTISIAMSSGTNLCEEGYSLLFEYETRSSNKNLTFTNIEMVAECDATVSRVPCTIYYYP